MSHKPWLIGNWKLNGDLTLLEAFDEGFSRRFGRGGAADKAHLGLAVPDLLLYPAMGMLSNLPVELGLQTCAAAAAGAHTGETSAALAQSLGASFVILGHSERRQDQGETSSQVRAKAEAAIAAGLGPIICVGETLADREAGQEMDVVLTQVRDSMPASGDVIIAYEPVWAIGTGKVASPEQAQVMHAAIRNVLPQKTTPILYGGSMKGSNAADLLAQTDIDGGLIGGASLKPQDFLAIYDACT